MVGFVGLVYMQNLRIRYALLVSEDIANSPSAFPDQLQKPVDMGGVALSLAIHMPLIAIVVHPFPAFMGILSCNPLSAVPILWHIVFYAPGQGWRCLCRLRAGNLTVTGDQNIFVPILGKLDESICICVEGSERSLALGVDDPGDVHGINSAIRSLCCVRISA